ncbi:palmitoleoyl-protein carboxylesterase NOTUM [Formica exsecta]|uniref:palmitoleoyl-protein carboxylesterase NOTUM n=1 Tax=Formica exsecta TaxID=72781 RepID=UPI0011434D25|nr:palmitoleoyl-protein carboxylesterase NOTUM [Formica exsecta]XP_029679291.1 palmitoleoyl-protein carboxylesterase NOTUM [Formica exsecta]
MRTVLQIMLCLVALILTITAEDKFTNTVSISSSSPAEYQSNTIQKLMSILGKYGLDDQRGLKRVYLSNRSITCNDGSQAGFYLRKSHGSRRWIMYLEGGWYCYDQKSCRARWMRVRHLMTSTQWPETRDVGGILSPNPDENPFFWGANHVFVPYCTSDSWSGTRAFRAPDDMFSFMGAEIVVQVVRDLVPLGLENASAFLLAGSSAGGTGVMLNLDRVQNLVHHELGLRHIAIRGVSDSGWFLDKVPYPPKGLSPVDAIQNGMELWKSRMPRNCVLKYPKEPWRCFFGYRLYPTLSAPLFVFQWIFDEAQMRAYNVAAPLTRQEWDYIHKMGDSLRHTLENVTAVFAPSCISHSVLTKRDWKMIKIDEVSFAQALFCWDHMPIGNHRKNNMYNNTHSQIETNQPCGKSLKKLLRSGIRKGNGTSIEGGKSKVGSSTETQKARLSVVGKTLKRRPASGSIQEQENKKRRRRKHKGRRDRKERKRAKEERLKKKEKHERRKGTGRRKQINGNNHTVIFNGTRPQRSVIPSNKRKCVEDCHFRMIERCTWPQCNHSCPKLHNPFTGEEMDLIELLKSFGLDMKSVANALGIDIHTLISMDQEKLVNLLTQRAN